MKKLGFGILLLIFIPTIVGIIGCGGLSISSSDGSGGSDGSITITSTGTIEGKVRNLSSKPLSGAHISFEGSSKYDDTDDIGFYQVSGLGADTYKM